MCKCDFCSAIYDLKKLIAIPEHKRTAVNAIVYDTKEKTFGLFHECIDEYYTDKIIDIEFCPMCGKRLSNDNLEEYCVNCKHSIVDGAGNIRCKKWESPYEDCGIARTEEYNYCCDYERDASLGNIECVINLEE